jgi:bifunctional non-homologous end joining protein LigD
MAAAPERPDRLVFDLDPGPGIAFAAIRAAARRLRALLAERGLTGFPRISGGKGIHVVVPIAAPRRGPAPDWPRAKAFALDLCRMLEKDEPARFTTRMAKSAGRGASSWTICATTGSRRRSPPGRRARGPSRWLRGR